MKVNAIISLWLCLISSSMALPLPGAILAYQDGRGQYNFGFSEPKLARSESRQSDGMTRGTYSYIDENGLIQTTEYEAGKDVGFRVKATNLPIAPHPITETPEYREILEKHLRLLEEANRRDASILQSETEKTENKQLPNVKEAVPESVIKQKEDILPSKAPSDVALPLIKNDQLAQSSLPRPENNNANQLGLGFKANLPEDFLTKFKEQVLFSTDLSAPLFGLTKDGQLVALTRPEELNAVNKQVFENKEKYIPESQFKSKDEASFAGIFNDPSSLSTKNNQFISSPLTKEDQFLTTLLSKHGPFESLPNANKLASFPITKENQSESLPRQEAIDEANKFISNDNEALMRYRDALLQKTSGLTDFTETRNDQLLITPKQQNNIAERIQSSQFLDTISLTKNNNAALLLQPKMENAVNKISYPNKAEDSLFELRTKLGENEFSSLLERANLKNSLEINREETPRQQTLKNNKNVQVSRLDHGEQLLNSRISGSDSSSEFKNTVPTSPELSNAFPVSKSEETPRQPSFENFQRGYTPEFDYAELQRLVSSGIIGPDSLQGLKNIVTSSSKGSNGAEIPTFKNGEAPREPKLGNFQTEQTAGFNNAEFQQLLNVEITGSNTLSGIRNNIFGSSSESKDVSIPRPEINANGNLDTIAMKSKEDTTLVSNSDVSSRSNVNSASVNRPYESVTYTPEVQKARDEHLRAHEAATKLAMELQKNPQLILQLLQSRPTTAQTSNPEPDMRISGQSKESLVPQVDTKINAEEVIRQSVDAIKTAGIPNFGTGFTPASTSIRVMDNKLPTLNEFQQSKLKSATYSIPIETSHISPAGTPSTYYTSLIENSRFPYSYL